MNCPACIGGLPAQDTKVGDVEKLCLTHKSELDAWLDGVVEKHEGEDLDSPKDAAGRRGGV